MPPELWFVAVTLTETKDRFPSFIRKTILKDPQYTPCRTGESIVFIFYHVTIIDIRLSFNELDLILIYSV